MIIDHIIGEQENKGFEDRIQDRLRLPVEAVKKWEER